MRVLRQRAPLDFGELLLSERALLLELGSLRDLLCRRVARQLPVPLASLGDEQPGNPNWTAFIFGCIAGIFPWIAIGAYLWGPGSSDLTPSFVYWIFVSMFVFFNSFAVNQVLQYKPVGKWKDYLFGEATYVFLSLTAKSLLAWLVFANVLIPG